MKKEHDKLLIAFSAVANHGKTKTGKQLIRELVIDRAFRELCTYYEVRKITKRAEPVTDISEDGSGDRAAYFYEVNGGQLLAAVITGGDGMTPELEKALDKAFASETVKVVVCACRPNNNVHAYLKKQAEQKDFLMVETSPFFVVQYACGSDGEKASLYKEWHTKRAKELREIVKEFLCITDSFKLRELHRQMKEEQSRGRLAFLLGNGINKYATNGACPSWNDLVKLICEETKVDYKAYDDGFTLTEQFDILRNHRSSTETDANITKHVQELVRELYPAEKTYYQFLSERFKDLSAPVLTTNFDTNLEYSLHRQSTPIHPSDAKDKLISDIYHWNEYYADEPIAAEDMGRKFSIWHVHGNINQQKTIRLDLSAYMAQVTYTRNFLRNIAHLWAVEKDGDGWGMETRGSSQFVSGYAFTWLNIFYNFSICINGLGLSTNETYLRWLLISRYKYQKRVGIHAKGWYIYSPDDKGVADGMKYFLRNVGVEPVMIENLQMRYENLFKL